jgi:hypothetical protein
MARRNHSYLRTAYHEAGHAVMGMILGRNIRWIDLGGTPEDPTDCVAFDPIDFDDPEDEALRQQARYEVMILSAGILAEAKFHGRPGSKSSTRTTIDVLKSYEHGFWLMTDDSHPRELLAGLMFYASATIYEPSSWRAVELLATALAEHQHLGGERAREIFESVWSPSEQSAEAVRARPVSYDALLKLVSEFEVAIRN